MNRCSEDIEAIDQLFPLMASLFLDFSFTILGSFILAGVVTPILFVFIIIIMIVFFFAMRKFLRTSTEMRRLS